MMMLQVSVLMMTLGCALSFPQYPAAAYGVPARYLQDRPTPSFQNYRYLQDFSRPLTHTLAVARPFAPPQNDQLELLPPLQHVVGTRYPAVTPGPGYRFPISQLLNPTEPPNLIH